MPQISDFLLTIDSYLGSSAWFVYLLLGTGLFYTIYLGFPQVRYFGRAIGITRGKIGAGNHVGDTSHFGALTTALSGTVGTGNIAGVALAIHLGGPGAMFWMLVTAILGMATKMTEVTLSLKYREKVADGSMSGGPMYYMKNKLRMKWLAAIFAIATILSSFGTGCLPQINSIANSFEATWGVDKFILGLVLSLIMALIIIKGIKRIAMVAERLIPTMAIIYVLGGLSVIFYNYDNILPSIASIFTNAFSSHSAVGGFLGAGFAWAFSRGVNRGLFSNEAGQGSAPIAHSAAKTDEPVSEGLVSMLEPFIDTVIICFMTGVILLSSGVWAEKMPNTFQSADIHVIESYGYSERKTEHVESLSSYLAGNNEAGAAVAYHGVIEVNEGRITSPVTMLHARSIAENVLITRGSRPYTGSLNVSDGRLSDHDIEISGVSLLHSAPLTTEAFSRGLLGGWGRYIVPICLLLFAFSTALAWSYYGDRAVTYLFGVKYVLPFRILYVLAFCVGSFADTTILWIFSGVTVAFMALPNLIGILLLHRDMKASLDDYHKRHIINK